MLVHQKSQTADAFEDDLRIRSVTVALLLTAAVVGVIAVVVVLDGTDESPLAITFVMP